MNTAVLNASAATAILSEYDFIAVVDCSGSMQEPISAGRTRWQAMQESLMTFIRDVEKIDSDGIDLVLLGAGNRSFTGVTADKCKEIFDTLSPRGSTPLAEALTEALKLAGKSAKKDFIVVFTDGRPDDEPAAAKVIRDQANKQTTDNECTILFVQVGNDRAATEYLRGLDDNLKGAKFDIVDAKTCVEVDAYATTTDLIVAAIND